MERTIENYPVAIIEDRYVGIYSGGRWIAIANADLPHHDSCRVRWALDDDPSGDDITAGMFWASPPGWIAAGGASESALCSDCRLRGMGPLRPDDFFVS